MPAESLHTVYDTTIGLAARCGRNSVSSGTTSEQRWREREAAEKAAEPERRRIMAERAQRDFDHMDRVNRGEHLRGK
jgi:hypothetical protein